MNLAEQLLESQGEERTTDCCDAPFYEPGYPDCDICSSCHEHAEPAEDDS